MSARPCSVASCTQRHNAQGYCRVHYRKARQAGLMAVTDKRPEVRFWSKVNKTTGCWEWTASCTPNGYGSFADAGGKLVPAHRWAYEHANGESPGDLLVCHRCDNRKCVRPDHLFLGTNQDNMLDMVAKGRQRPLSSTCRHGHPYTPENTMLAKGRAGKLGRRCVTCYRRNQASAKARRKAFAEQHTKATQHSTSSGHTERGVEAMVRGGGGT